MLKLPVERIIENIHAQRPVSATADDGSFSVLIENYVGFVAAAVHAGHHMPDALEAKSALCEFERWQEEDPLTDRFIAGLPIQLIAHDSRYAYDLNRSPQECLYETAWGKKVWREPLNQKERQESLKRHASFYKIVDALLTQLTKKHKRVVVYDVHSFNHKRREGALPLFNIGTENIDAKKYRKTIERWMAILAEVRLPGEDVTVAENEVFYGRGYFLKQITKRFDDALVLATEVKKVFCDEISGEEFEDITAALAGEIRKSVLKHASSFTSD